jgi:hypothetical protein
MKQFRQKRRFILDICKGDKMMTMEQIKPTDSNECPQPTAEMDFLIAQKMMYQITTVTWPQPSDGPEAKVHKNTYEMTLSDFLEHWHKNLNKNIENVISIKPI